MRVEKIHWNNFWVEESVYRLEIEEEETVKTTTEKNPKSSERDKFDGAGKVCFQSRKGVSLLSFWNKEAEAKRNNNMGPAIFGFYYFCPYILGFLFFVSLSLCLLTFFNIFFCYYEKLIYTRLHRYTLPIDETI